MNRLIFIYLIIIGAALAKPPQDTVEADTKPLIFLDASTGIYLYVESDRRHVTAFDSEGKILWHRNPFVDAHLESFFPRVLKPIINWVGRDPNRENKLAIGFNSSQFGTLDYKTGDFEYAGQD
jgi:hypothetical protein